MTTAELTRAAMAEKRKANHRIGEIPFGWRLAEDGTLREEEAEQRVLDLIRECREAGISLRKIADHLTGLGILTKKGNAKWNHNTVNSVLKRDRLLRKITTPPPFCSWR